MADLRVVIARELDMEGNYGLILWLRSFISYNDVGGIKHRFKDSGGADITTIANIVSGIKASAYKVLFSSDFSKGSINVLVEDITVHVENRVKTSTLFAVNNNDCADPSDKRVYKLVLKLIKSTTDDDTLALADIVLANPDLSNFLYLEV